MDEKWIDRKYKMLAKPCYHRLNKSCYVQTFNW